MWLSVFRESSVTSESSTVKCEREEKEDSHSHRRESEAFEQVPNTPPPVVSTGSWGKIPLSLLFVSDFS